jgi:ABC-type transport system involved in multi-copper enzyme maturation permease subunit
MAKIKCLECKRKNSYKALECENCGSNLTIAKVFVGRRYRALFFIFAILGFVFLFGSLFSLIAYPTDDIPSLQWTESFFSIGCILSIGGLALLFSTEIKKRNVFKIGLKTGLIIMAPIILMGIFLGYTQSRILLTLSLIYSLIALGAGQGLAFFMMRKTYFRIDMKNLSRDLDGAYVIVKREFFTNLLSIRMVLILLIFGIAILGYASYDAGSPSIGQETTPDYVMSRTATQIICTMGPLIAIALSFDSVTREKSQGSLNFLLCRPISKRAIALGKFTGVMAALILPVIVLTLIAVPIISSLMGSYPSVRMITGVIISTTLLMATFALIQMILSTVAKTSATAILSGIGVWLFFNFFWAIIVIIVFIALGREIPTNPIGIIGVLAIAMDSELGPRISLFNPGGVLGGNYNMGVGQLAGNVHEGIPEWGPWVGMVAWFLIIFIAAIEIFNRKGSE